MTTEYKSRSSLAQIAVALVATVLIGSVALVGTVGPANAAPLQIAAQSHG
jgi:hypothetical protein